MNTLTFEYISSSSFYEFWPVSWSESELDPSDPHESSSPSTDFLANKLCWFKFSLLLLPNYYYYPAILFKIRICLLSRSRTLPPFWRTILSSIFWRLGVRIEINSDCFLFISNSESRITAKFRSFKTFDVFKVLFSLN